MLKNKFNVDLKKGEAGEEVIKNYLDSLDWVDATEDVRDIKEYQQDDIDFIVKTSYAIEVKADSLAHKTGNLAYEYISNKNYNTEGCFEKTKSDYIYYYLIATKELYIIDTKKLQQYVANNKDNLKLVPMGDYALGYLIPLKTIIDLEMGDKYSI